LIVSVQANISTVLPLLVLGIVGVLGGITALFLPETLDKELPQTLQDGENFGKGQQFLDFPCCSKLVEFCLTLSKPSECTQNFPSCQYDTNILSSTKAKDTNFLLLLLSYSNGY
jgi:hypothetical protein